MLIGPWLRKLDKPWSGALVAIVAAAMRFPAIGFGLPFIWNPDEPTNVGTGALMVSHGTWNPHVFIYPSMLYEVIATFGWGQQAIGGWHAHAGLTSENVGIAWTADPHLFIVLRVVTILLAIGACIVVWGLVSVLVKKWWVATLAALLLAVSPLMMQFDVTVTPDTYAAFFTAIGLLTAVLLLRRHSLRYYALAGVGVGLAAGAKYNAALVAVAVIAAHFLGYGEEETTVKDASEPVTPGRLAQTWSRHARPLVLAGLAAGLAFVATTPGAIISPRQFFDQATEIARGYATIHRAGTSSSPLLFYVSSYFDQGVIFIVLGVAGLFSLFGRWWRESIVLTIFTVCYVGLIGVQKTAYARDLLPALPALAILAGLGVATIAERLRPAITAKKWVWGIAVALALGGLVQPLITTARLPITLNQHPNVEAEAWINSHIPKGSIIWEDSYGPYLPPLKYRLREPLFLAQTKSFYIPAISRAIVVTQLGSGRFLSQPKAYPATIANYRRIQQRFCLGASFNDGPWVRVLVPCRK